MQTSTRAIQREPGVVRAKKEARELLSMYQSPPNEEITLEDFELYALDRLQVLRQIEAMNLRNIRGEEYRKKLDAALAESLPLRGYSEKDAIKDRVSHFILRIAYCKTEDLRRWFLKFESQLFNYRLERLDASDRAKFMEENGVGYDIVSKEDLQRIRPQLLASQPATYNMGTQQPADPLKSHYYRIPFTQALDLVRKREVFLQRGFAYVPMDKLVSIITARFRTNLSKGLLDALHAFPYITGDARLAPMINNMNKQYTGKDYSKTRAQGEVNIDDLDELAERSFPLCMKVLHRGLKSEHKLKHFGRLQYGLFIKGLGISVEDAIVFWQREFTKIVTPEVFNKQYAYNIRHYYGKEGHRRELTPYSCVKIIMHNQAPGAGDYHGCPFKHFDQANLGRLLDRENVGFSERESIMQLASNQGYQLACQKHFEVTHKGWEDLTSISDVGNHPNAWFAASENYYKALQGDNKEVSQIEGGEKAAKIEEDTVMESGTNAVEDMEAA